MKRLADKHPTVKRLARIFTKIEAEGIKIHRGRDGGLMVTDLEFPSRAFDLRDADGSEVHELSPTFEWKLTEGE